MSTDVDDACGPPMSTTDVDDNDDKDDKDEDDKDEDEHDDADDDDDVIDDDADCGGYLYSTSLLSPQPESVFSSPARLGCAGMFGA